MHTLLHASLLWLALTAAHAAPPPPPLQPPQTSSGNLSPPARLGELLFNDKALSASGKQSCMSCHSAEAGFSAANRKPVQFGGADLGLSGLRNAPSLKYLVSTPPFGVQTVENQLMAKGGLMRDGRLATLAQQAQQPFITSFEMANAGAGQVRQRLLARPYLPQFVAVFGKDTLADPDKTLAAIGQAIARFETESVQFQPFNSKYDAFLQGKLTFTPGEQAGLALFVNPAKGNCQSCHSASTQGGKPPLFTDFSYHALGIPRNWEIAFNNDNAGLPAYIVANGIGLGSPAHNYYDLGLCGPLRSDLSSQSALCGRFKVPTLRNVALKQRYFHNGVFGRLHQVVNFYSTRLSQAQHWYVKADGSPDILFNDLPQRYAANVVAQNKLSSRLSDAEITQLVSFLCTLSDGFDSQNPASYPLPEQCKAP